VLQFYRQRGRVPFVLRKDACFPASFDAVLGWWVYQVALIASLITSDYL
jgi:hypothetical protein